MINVRNKHKGTDLIWNANVQFWPNLAPWA